MHEQPVEGDDEMQSGGGGQAKLCSLLNIQAILTYQSKPLRLMRTAWKAVPLVLDWSKEDQIIKVLLVENYIEDSANPVARASIKISSPDLQVYKTSIHIDAHFHGLRYAFAPTCHVRTRS